MFSTSQTLLWWWHTHIFGITSSCLIICAYKNMQENQFHKIICEGMNASFMYSLIYQLILKLSPERENSDRAAKDFLWQMHFSKTLHRPFASEDRRHLTLLRADLNGLHWKIPTFLVIFAFLYGSTCAGFLLKIACCRFFSWWFFFVCLVVFFLQMMF